MPHAPDPPDLLGRSPAFRRARQVLERACRVEAPLLLEGETGTGKTLAAQWIHARSPRALQPFVPVNCAGIPESLFESELFGHRRGAFTGAVDDRAGLFEAASGGTLFLDEVAELPRRQQGKLLTVLDEGRVRRVGEIRTRQTDVRIVSATVRDVDRMVRDGELRADLFHRLALLRVALPPLRERLEDLELLSEAILEACGNRHLGTPARLTPAALERLRHHPWPGNIRELAHVLEAALILSGRRCLDRSHLDPALSTPSPVQAPGATGEAADGGTQRRRYSFYGTDEEEKERIRASLTRFDGNRTRAARHLGMSRATLRARIRKYELE